MTNRSRFYFDNAATSWPKPPSVYQAVESALRDNGASAGRGSYESSLTAARIVEDARRGAARLLGAEQASSIAFGFNGTDVLNLAINGLLPCCQHVVTTAAEHNSVLRPLHAWRDATSGRLTIVDCDLTGRIDVPQLLTALEDRADLLVFTHASNVTGTVQPIDEICTAARERDVVTILDAAQTLGHESLDVRRTPVDVVAASGHKGLLGPLGTGLMYARSGIAPRLVATRLGGTGTQSDQPFQPSEMPWRLESGNHNVPGLAGLAAGLTWIEAQTIERLSAEANLRTAELIAGLRSVGGLSLYGAEDETRQTSVVSFTIEGFDPQEVAGLLDSQYGIEVRSGLHCAPLIHRALGTLNAGGTVRASLGPFNTAEQVAQLIEAVAEIAAAVEN